MDDLIAGAAGSASNHKTGAVTLDNDLDVGRSEGDGEIHRVEEDEGPVAEAAAWTGHPQTDTVNDHRAVDGEVEIMMAMLRG